MRKITNFIIKGRYFFLTLFIILAGLGLFLSTKVNINEDIMKYLPVTSETKIGKDIMEKEFAEQDSSVLNVMFKDLSPKDKEQTLKKLKNITGVNSVDYNNTNQYNKKNYTLYVLNVADYDNSKTATYVYNYVKDNFKTAGMSGSIYDENKPILQLWIVVLAITFAMIILIILSDSYLEPWLYLISIGIAIFINKGTNIIFGSVSSITNSIVAILQLALSMDYSIMLSNRYKQEKEKQSNKIEAMKEALYQSFKSISSSSVTTIVGLIALVFMSFTIGKDLGYVLAKGVLLSLASIFFCLPALLLIFDNLIAKTKKKSPQFNLTKLGQYIYKTRFIQSFLIIVLFLAAYLLKGNVNILYTGSQQDKVGAIFPPTNQVAIVYNNKYENIISNYCKQLETNKNIDQVLCYSNTLNEKLAYDELNKKFKDLGQNIEIDDYLIKLIYYNYYTKDTNNKMTLAEFISFIKSDIYTNDEFKARIDQETKNNLNLLENFTTSSLINKKRTSKEIATILGITEEDAENILIYYNSKNLNTTMTIEEFINFMLNDISHDKKYSSSLDPATISKLQQLQNFTDLSKINKKMSATELSKIFGIDKNVVEQLFLFYRTTIESNTKLSLNQVATLALDISHEETYKDMFTENTIKSLSILKTLSDSNIINNELTEDAMQTLLNKLGLNLDNNNLSLLYIYYTGYNTESKLTLDSFSTTALNISTLDPYNSYFNAEIKESLQTIKTLNSLYNTELAKDNLYKLFKIDTLTGEKLSSIIGSDPMTPITFVDLLLQNDLIVSQLNSAQLTALKTAQYIMHNIETTYSVNELSNVLSQDKTLTSMIYGVYDLKQGKLKNISLKNLINFINSNKTNPLLASYFLEIKDYIDLATLIVNNIDTTYNYTEISNIIGVDKSLINKIFGIYDYTHESTNMTPLELANLILNNKSNPLLANYLSSKTINTLILVKEVMTSTINQTKYTSEKLSSLLGINTEELSLLFSLYNSKYVKTNQEISLYNYADFIIKDVMNNKEYASNFNTTKKEKLTTINTLMNNSLQKTKYSQQEAFNTLTVLSNNLDKSLLDLVYMYYGSIKEYNYSWKITIEEFVNYLNSDILPDKRFNDFIDNQKRTTIKNSKNTVAKSKKLITSDKYSRIILNTKYAPENKTTFNFIKSLKDKIGNKDDIYVVGNSPMAVEMSKTFNNELNKITILTMIFIFIVVAITFKDLIIPFVLVLIIQTAVYITMSAISLTGGSVYFISLLIVQAILMGATIDYAIVYTSYYRESRLTMGVKDSVINAYNKSIHTIISSSSILIIVTLVVANFASAIAAKICETISQGTFASVLLILFILPGVLATTDKLICRKGYYQEKNNLSKNKTN